MMRFRENGSHLFTFLHIAESAHRGFKKEHPQDGEQDDKLEHNEPDQRLSPGHIPKTIPVQVGEKGEYAPAFLHSEKTND